MATSRELIEALRARGVSNQAIATALGRDRSTISQVARGVKPGANLTGSLAELRDRLAQVDNPDRAARAAQVAPPARRQTAAGKPARVRRPTTHKAGHSTTSTVKRQGAQHGAKGVGRALAGAIEDGATVAVTIKFSRAVTVSPPDSRGRKTKSRPGAGGILSAAFDPDAQDELAELLDAGATPGEAVAAVAISEGWIYPTGGGGMTPADAVRAMQSLELRTF